MVELGGYVEPGFEKVRDAFERNFAEHGEVGAGFCLHVDGRPVVDLWGGTYREDTLQLVFSSTKGATAACANLLAQRGLLDVDAPVATYWPEFAAAGKENLPVRYLLTHQAGLPFAEVELSAEECFEWEPVVNALAAQAPMWEPGTAHGYHALSFGWLVGEVIRRIDGRGLGTFFADEIADPLGLEFWIGLPETHERRVMPLTGGALSGEEPDSSTRAMLEQFLGPDSLLGRALSLNGAFADTSIFNTRACHAAELGAAGGITNARSLSRMYAGLTGPLADLPGSTALLDDKQIEAARETQTSGNDRCLFFETTFGLGFMTSSQFAPFGGKGSFGHPGAGGSVGFADPENRLAFGYVMNRMMQNLSGDPRSRGLVLASYEALGLSPDFA